MAEQEEVEILADKPKSGVDDLKEAIANVLIGSKKGSELIKMGMGAYDVGSKKVKAVPLSSYNLNYDAPSTHLESVYFWILDFMQDTGISIEKVTDNFTSAPGSGHFAEMGMRASRMQDQGMKIFAMINQVVKTILNLVYDLKEFEIRLGHYEDARSDDVNIKEGGMLALKQIWMDNVDMKKGNTSIKAMAFSQASFATLIDAFLIVKDESLKGPGGHEIDLNDRVKRLLKQRILEFNRWKELSERELKKRFAIERSYLKSEVESLKLYSAWAKPYLKAAQELRQKGFDKNPALVSAFNTTLFELVLFGKRKVKFEEAAKSGELPKGLADYKMKRDYYECFVVSFLFKGFPQKVTQQHYGFGGRVDMYFYSYALNEQEIELLSRELEKQNVEDSLKFVEETTASSLEELKDDLDRFVLKDEDVEKKVKEKKKAEDINPFSALLDLFKFEKSKDKKKITEAKKIKPDNFVEAQVRALAAKNAQNSIYNVYDIYKKSHGMASAPGFYGGFLNEAGE